MKYCRNCGSQLEDEAVFCTECGTRQDVRTEQPENYAEQAQPENVEAVAAGNAEAAPIENAETFTAGNAEAVPNEGAEAFSAENAGAAPTEGAGAFTAENSGVAPTSEATKKPFFKRPLGIAVIVIAAVLVIGGIVLAAVSSNPKVKVVNAIKNTAKDVQNISAIKFLGSVGEKGSVTATMDMEELLGEFGLDVDGELVYKQYFDSNKYKTAATADFKIHDATAIDANVWISPESVILSSDVLLGKDAYGIGIKSLQDNLKGSDYEDLLPSNVYDAIEDADERIFADLDGCRKIMTEYLTDVGTYFGKQVVENADFEESKDEVDFAASTVKADVITVTIDENSMQDALEKTIQYAEKEAKFDEARALLASYLEFYMAAEGDYDPDGEELLEEVFENLYDAADDLDEMEVESRFYIYKSRLVRLEVEDSETETELSFTLGPNPSDPELFEIALEGEYIDYRIGWEVETNTSSEYEAKLYMSEPGDDYKINLTWDKKNGDFAVKMKDFVSISGLMKKSGSEVSMEIDKIKILGEKQDIGISLLLKSKDNMPSAPAYTDLLTMDIDDLEDIVEDIEDSIYELAEDWE